MLVAMTPTDRGDGTEPRSLAFAEWLEAKMKERGIGQRELERRANIGHSSINDYLSGAGYPRLPSIRKLARVFSVDEAEISALIPSSKSKLDLVDVWSYEDVRLSGGAPIGIGTFQGTYRVRSPAERGHDFGLFQVTGDCMAPRIDAGDSIVVDMTRRDGWRVGDLVALAHDGDVLVKKVAGSREMPVLVADDGTTVVPNGDTRIIGVVVEIRKRP